MGFTALPAQAQMNPQMGQQMNPTQSVSFITTRGDAPNFGLSIIPGTQLPTGAVCQNATNNQNQKQKTVCIKIPDDPAQRIWWRDQYLDQLKSQGWNTVDLGMNAWPFMAMATGIRPSGCNANLFVLMVYDGDGREAQNKTGTLLEALDATYLVFLDHTPHCQS